MRFTPEYWLATLVALHTMANDPMEPEHVRDDVLQNQVYTISRMAMFDTFDDVTKIHPKWRDLGELAEDDPMRLMYVDEITDDMENRMVIFEQFTTRRRELFGDQVDEWGYDVEAWLYTRCAYLNTFDINPHNVHHIALHRDSLKDHLEQWGLQCIYFDRLDEKINNVLAG